MSTCTQVVKGKAPVVRAGIVDVSLQRCILPTCLNPARSGLEELKAHVACCILNLNTVACVAGSYDRSAATSRCHNI